MTDRELMQQALDALEAHADIGIKADKQIEALRARLAQPEQEPVAWMHTTATGDIYFRKKPHDKVFSPQPVYTTPPQREWQGLTDEEMMVAAFQAGFDVHEDYDNEDDPDALHWWSEDGEPCDDTLHKLRDIIEAKLKEKNT